MATWRKVIVSGSTAELNHVSSSGNLVPTATDGGALGTTTLNWSDLFLDSGAVINFDSGDVTATHAANLLTIAGGNVRVDKLEIDGANDSIDVSTDMVLTSAADITLAAGGANVKPNANNTIALGVSGTGFSDIFLGTGAVINFHEGDITLTHAANLLTIGGGSTRVDKLEIDGANDHIDVSTDMVLTAAADITLTPGGANVKPGSDSAINLGVSGTAFRKLFVDDIDFNAQGGIVGGLHVSASSFNASTHITASGDLYVANNGYVGGNFEAVGDITGSAFSGSGAATFDSLTLDTVLAVAEGGTGASALTDKAVLISQDSGTDAIGSLAMSTNGVILVGGTNGPAVEAPADVAGTGLDAAVGDGTLAINVAAAQTSITSIYNTGLKIGRGASDTYIDFGTDDSVKISAANTVRLHTDTAGVHVTGTLDVSGNATIEGDLVVNGDTTTLSTTNLAVGDAFIFAATGSAGTNVDGGLIVQSGSAVDSGSAIYHDINSQRWSVAKGTALNATAETPLEFVVTVKALGDDDAAAEADKEYGVGEMAIQNDGTIWIYS